MTGFMKITYTVLCDNDLNKIVTVKELLNDEKIAKVIKSTYAPQLRNIELSSLADECIKVATSKKEYSLEIEKDDFADALTLAEEDAKKRKLFKKGCERVELIDMVTL